MVTPDITETLPSLVSAREVSAQGAARGAQYDVTLSGVGFVLDTSSQTPYQRQTVDVQKQQIDTSTEAGEQTLDGGWIRSQTSWHLGAGATYYEPGSRDEAVPSKYRFFDSRGVDVWSPGQLTLLRKMDQVDSGTGTVAVCGARLATGDAWYSRVGTNVYRHDSGGTTLQASSAFISSRMALAGSVVLIGSTFGVYKMDLLGTTITQLTTQALGSTVDPYWVKSRIISTRANELHQHTLTGGAVDATSRIFSHPDTGWLWTGVTEAPDAIIAAGYAGGRSAIYAFTLSDAPSGSIPVIGQGYEVASLPPGEEIRSIRSYLGKYLGIGTTAGVRIGVISEQGRVQYGPLLVETSSPVVSLAARDSFMYAAAGTSVIRVNLAETVDDGLRFPYAYDVETPYPIDHLAFDGVSNRVVTGSNAHGTWVASKTDYVPAGWLVSGSIRYSTTVAKAFRTIDVDADTVATTNVAVSGQVGSTPFPLVTLTNGRSGNDISLRPLPVPLTEMTYRLDLAGTAGTPVVNAVAVRAVPVPKRTRLIQYPLLLVDRGRDSNGLAFGKAGYASSQLQALEDLESSQKIILVTDRERSEQYEAVIERTQFTRVTKPSKGNNFGGTALVTVRTV